MQVFKCDICGSLNEFEVNNVLTNKDKSIHADLCASCAADVLEYIHDEHLERDRVVPTEPESEALLLEKAKGILKQYGFVFYKPAATRNRSSKKK